MLIRASTFPYPGSFTFFKNKKLIIWKAKCSPLQGIPGKISFINNEVYVGTRKGSIVIKKASIGLQEMPTTQIFKKEDNEIILPS